MAVHRLPRSRMDQSGIPSGSAIPDSGGSNWHVPVTKLGLSQNRS
jgi:hypothetical protein